MNGQVTQTHSGLKNNNPTMATALTPKISQSRLMFSVYSSFFFIDVEKLI